MPRQNERQHQGDIREYVLQASDDGAQWHEVARGELASTFNPQTIRFPQTVTARSLKLTALSGFGADTATALADIAVLYAGPPLPDTGPGTIQYRPGQSATPEIDEGVPARPAR